jgi:hypothetical protein
MGIQIISVDRATGIEPAPYSFAVQLRRSKPEFRNHVQA